MLILAARNVVLVVILLVCVVFFVAILYNSLFVFCLTTKFSALGLWIRRRQILIQRCQGFTPRGTKISHAGLFICTNCSFSEALAWYGNKKTRYPISNDGFLYYILKFCLLSRIVKRMNSAIWTTTTKSCLERNVPPSLWPKRRGWTTANNRNYDHVRQASENKRMVVGQLCRIAWTQGLQYKGMSG